MTDLRQAVVPVTTGPELAQRLDEAMHILDRVARRLARRYARVACFEELRSLGRVELLPIVTSWDPARAPFHAWMKKKLEWAIIDGVRRETHGRTAGARAMALVAAELVAGDSHTAEACAEDVDAAARLDRLLASRAAALAVGLLAGAGAGEGTTDAVSPEEQATVREAAARVRAAVAALPERQRALVEGFYWHGEQLDVVGRRLGISKSWASRLHAQAIDRLRRALPEVAG